MDWNKSRRKERYKQPRPKYINFPISFFSSLDGERLDVPQFKAMVGEIIRYGVADWYRRECSAWQNPHKYSAPLFSQVLEKMELTTNGHNKSLFSCCLYHMDAVANSRGKAFCGIPIEWLLSFRDDDKSDYECLQFLAYCAIRSILGHGLFDGFIPVPKRITWEFILSRMAGNDKRVPVEDLPPFIAHYCKRRSRDKLRKSLIKKWHLQTDGQSRGPGGAYYMIHDGEPIAEAIEILKACKQTARKRRGKGPADTDRSP